MKAMYFFEQDESCMEPSFYVRKYIDRVPRKDEIIDITDNFMIDVEKEQLKQFKAMFNFTTGQYKVVGIVDNTANQYAKWSYNIHLVKI